MNKILPLSRDIINIIGKYNLPTKESIKPKREFSLVFTLKFHLRYIKYDLNRYRKILHLYKITRIKYEDFILKRYSYSWVLTQKL